MKMNPKRLQKAARPAATPKGAAVLGAAVVGAVVVKTAVEKAAKKHAARKARKVATTDRRRGRSYAPRCVRLRPGLGEA